MHFVKKGHPTAFPRLLSSLCHRAARGGAAVRPQRLPWGPGAARSRLSAAARATGERGAGSGERLRRWGRGCELRLGLRKRERRGREGTATKIRTRAARFGHAPSHRSAPARRGRGLRVWRRTVPLGRRRPPAPRPPAPAAILWPPPLGAAAGGASARGSAMGEGGGAGPRPRSRGAVQPGPSRPHAGGAGRSRLGAAH